VKTHVSEFTDIPELDEAARLQIQQAISTEIEQRPPTIGLIGVSGVGKSFTINTMFKTDLPTSDVVACTKEFRTNELAVNVTSGELAGQEVQLHVIDAPGLGEDVQLDPKYLAMYRQELPLCDVILWILTARNRAVALDQMYLQQLAEFSDKMVFGINQVDLVEPLNWNHKLNAPSEEQMANIEIIRRDRKEKIESVLGRSIEVFPYSAKQKFDLQQLFTGIIEACPEERAWIFSTIKNFSHLDFLPDDIREVVLEKIAAKQRAQARK